jgi:molybdate transport system substrate-binding protein
MNYATRSIFSLLAVMVCGSFFLHACSPGSQDKGVQKTGVVSLKADETLRPALLELAQKYEQETSNKIKLKFAASMDIKLDDPTDSVDVYVLANDPVASSLLDTSTNDPSRKRTLAYAIPCIVIPGFNPAMISTLSDLTENNIRMGISDPKKDILGQFAVEILQKNRVYDKLAGRLIIASSAQDLAERVARKNLDAAIGWANFPTWTQGGTDVVLLAASEIPRIAAISARRSNVSPDSTQAIKLMMYLGSDRALEVLRKWGYIISKTDIEQYATVAHIGGTPE